ncbi:MAG: proton-conducting transporter membrane subunit, partial [candidate division WOR-3 bacterium]
ELSWTIAVLIFIGLLAKSATLPLYIWLPRAYHVAPAPVCALLSGVTENLGVVVFFKLFVQTVHAPEGFMVFTAALGIMSSIVAAGVALGRPTIRELLAYSTVSQLGFIFLGLAIAGYYGIVGGLLYVLAHALAKAGLFFTAGVVEETTGTEELEKLGGFYRRAPVLAGAAALLVLSMIGLPPMLGFFAKVVLVIAAVRENLLLGVGAIVAALFTVLYMSRLYVRMFLGPERTVPVRGVSGFVVGLVGVLATASIATGLTWFLIARYLEPALAGVIGS